MDNTTTTNNSDITQKSDDMNMDQLLSLIKEQTKELKLNKKKLEKLEEKFIKINADLKNVLNDKIQIENFLRSIFPKEMHDNIIKTEYGLYDSGELCKLNLVCESQKQNEFQQILNRQKNENFEMTEKIKNISKEFESKAKEFNQLKSNSESNLEQLNFYQTNFSELNKKVELLENEKIFLVKMLDNKNDEIEKLTALELENAELKAKSLLENLEKSNNYGNNTGSTSLSYTNNATNYSRGFNAFNNSLDSKNEAQSNEKIFKLCKKTSEQFYSSEYVIKLDKQITELRQKLEKTRKEFNEYKEKSHKLLMNNEENFNKLIKENETLKKEISQILNEHLNQTNQITLNNNNNILFVNGNSGGVKNSNFNLQSFPSFTTELNSKLRKDSLKSLNGSHYTSLDGQSENKINIEYLKNVFLKYLEAITIGNEFQSKLLENVLFTILRVPKSEKDSLEEKRARSSFYYNLWYNAKAFLSSKFYGNSDSQLENNNPNSSQISQSEQVLEKDTKIISHDVESK